MGFDMNFNSTNNDHKNDNFSLFQQENQNLQNSFNNSLETENFQPDDSSFNSYFYGDSIYQKKKEEDRDINNFNFLEEVNENNEIKNEKPINNIQKSTAETSEKLSKEKEKEVKKEIEIIFKVEKIKQNLQEKIQKAFDQLKNTKIYRKDYYFKRFKTKFINWLKVKLNNLKQDCRFFPKLEDFKIPNSLLFTSNPKIDDNYKFLNSNIKELLVLGENIEKKNSQFYNKELIKKVEFFEGKSKNKKKYDELISLINMSLKDAYYEFYNDEEAYKDLRDDKMMLFYEYNFRLETKNEYSLLKKYGFVEVLEKCHK